MRDIINIVASVDITMVEFRRGLISSETVREIFEKEWNRNLYALMRGMKE